MKNLLKTGGFMLTALLATVSFHSCKDSKQREKEKLEPNLKTFFKANMLDSTETLDTFRLIRIDTISQQLYTIEQTTSLMNDRKALLDIMTLDVKQMSLAADQVRLYRMIESPELVEIERKKVMDLKSKTDEIQVEMDTLSKIIDGLILTSKSSDSLKPVGYQARCLYQVQLKDKSVKRDTASILLNLNKDIVKYKDFLKVPYQVDFDKYRD